MPRKVRPPADTARNRENQQRSRARRREYVASLEDRVRAYEAEETKASLEIQRAARHVAWVNQRLLELLALKGVGKEEVDAFLLNARQQKRDNKRSSSSSSDEDERERECECEGEPAASGGGGGGGDCGPCQLNFDFRLVRKSSPSARPLGRREVKDGSDTPIREVDDGHDEPQDQAFAFTNTEKHFLDAKRGIESVYPPSLGGSSRHGNEHEIATAQRMRNDEILGIDDNDNRDRVPFAPTPIPTPTLAPIITTHGFNLRPRSQLSTSSSSSSSTYQQLQKKKQKSPNNTAERPTTALPALVTSCDDAATIIANFQGHGDPVRARSALGCGDAADCHVKNTMLFQLME